jgi:hypothetical protein
MLHVEQDVFRRDEETGFRSVDIESRSPRLAIAINDGGTREMGLGEIAEGVPVLPGDGVDGDQQKGSNERATASWHGNPLTTCGSSGRYPWEKASSPSYHLWVATSGLMGISSSNAGLREERLRRSDGEEDAVRRGRVRETSQEVV